MYCSKCGSNFGVSAKFCSSCDTAITTPHQQVVQEPPPPIKSAIKRMTKQLSSTAFVLLILVSTFATALILSEKGIGTILLSALIAETFAATAVGFFVAKLVTKNKRRTWTEIIWFQVFNFAGGFLSLAAGRSMKILVALVFTFLASAILFWLQNKSGSDPK